MRRRRRRHAPYVLPAVAFFVALGLSITLTPGMAHDSNATERTASPGRAATIASHLPQAEAIWVNAPAQGQIVGMEFVIEGKATTYDSIVLWELRYDGDSIDSGRAFGDKANGGKFAIPIHAPSSGIYNVALYESKGSEGRYSQLTVRQVQVQ